MPYTWRCFVLVVVILLVTVRSDTAPSVKKAYEDHCLLDNDCQKTFSCNIQLKQCLCGISQNISTDRLTCLDAVQYGEPCVETTQCLLVHTNSECKTTCQCAPSFHYAEMNDDHSCVTDATKYGTPCSSPAECEQPFTCSAKKCDCPADHSVSEDKMNCVAVAKKYDTPCSSAAECEQPFTCSGNKCDCPADHSVSEDKLKCVADAKKYGTPCSSPAECEQPFTCSASKKCECPADHSASEDKLKCMAGSRSVTVLVSVGLVLLGCLFSLFPNTRLCHDM